LRAYSIPPCTGSTAIFLNAIAATGGPWALRRWLDKGPPQLAQKERITRCVTLKERCLREAILIAAQTPFHACRIHGIGRLVGHLPAQLSEHFLLRSDVILDAFKTFDVSEQLWFVFSPRRSLAIRIECCLQFSHLSHSKRSARRASENCCSKSRSSSLNGESLVMARWRAQIDPRLPCRFH